VSERHNRVEEALGGSVATVCRFSGRHPFAVIALLLVVTLVLASGLPKIYVRSADYDLLPNNHPATLANERTLPEVPGYRSIESVWLEVQDPNLQNITGEQQIRAIDEAARFIESRVPGIRYTYDLPYLVKLINYTASGVPPAATIVEGAAGGDNSTLPLPAPLNRTVPPLPQPPPQAGAVTDRPIKPPDIASFQLPPDSPTFARDWEVVFNGAPDAVAGVVNDGYTGSLLVFMYDINLTRQGPPAVLPQSSLFIEAVNDFRARQCEQSAIRAEDGRPVLNCDRVYILGEALNAHMTDLASEDFRTWAPVVFVATLIVLLFAFGGDLLSTFIAFIAFTLGLAWTYGYMGHAGIPLTFFGLLIVPITLGVGKEYAIYMTNQLIEYGARGMSKAEAIDLTGRRAGGALLLSSLTSIAGLATMYLAPFKIMQDLAVLCIIAFAALFVISVTFIPACHGLRRKLKGKPFAPSHLMGAVGRGAANRKVLVAALLVVGTVVLAAESANIEEYFGISGGFQEGDYLEESYQYYNEVLGGSGTELVVIEGDVAAPETIDYLNALDDSFKADTATIPKASNVNSLIIALETYYALKDGLTNPAALNNQLNRTSIPRDRAVIAADIRAMFDHPAWGPAIALFTGPSLNVTVTHVFYHIGSETFDGLEKDFNSLTADVNRVPKPATVREVNLVGTQDTFYLYVKYGQPWLGTVTLYAAIITLAIALLVIRKPRDIAAFMVPMVLSGIWWAGLLPLFDIKASLTLMLPTVFLISVGSDYAVQYVWNYRQIGDMEEVYVSTGKANLYVVISTVIAFLFFVPMKLVLSSQGALAAALAIITIFLVTTFAVPLFYSKSAFGSLRRRTQPAAAPPPSAVTTPVTVVSASPPTVAKPASHDRRG
jgi:predicted RND superfamily exporter protein